jgi:hypothetical protein
MQCTGGTFEWIGSYHGSLFCNDAATSLHFGTTSELTVPVRLLLDPNISIGAEDADPGVFGCSSVSQSNYLTNAPDKAADVRYKRSTRLWITGSRSLLLFIAHVLPN